MSDILKTPAAKWRQEGQVDPHGDHYNCQRAALTLGELTDDELANGVFLHGNEPLNVNALLRKTPGYHSAVVWLTAGKDRIRWLSRALEDSKAREQALQQRLNAADQRIDELTPRLSDHLEGKRERFQKWVMATKHPVFGFLDGRSLARGDDRTGYADEYVQGLWVAYLAFGAFASRDDSIAWLKRIDGIGQNRAELIYSMGFRRLAD
ncbi:hypothetical protein [Pseudomonas rustica]|uniref:Uncharacterized protein n=1 Tax=Pseudomonas rustica TaxID=2827099 RepID=A0ABS5MSL6_9PSED|nr:hypothetical protein [Pseudomonas rustica]MBS4077274.1 hypothetical protein [Pseudomonas rustica]